MRCPYCDTQIPEGKQTCTKCGVRQDLGETQTIIIGSQTTSGKEETNNTETDSSSETHTVAVSESSTTGNQVRVESLSLGSSLGSRYRIERLLGQGGMGSVYLAYDKELDRQVALKMIRPELASNENVLARFKREIQLSSKVTHPNVLRVYDLGEEDGIRFLTMQFVEGEDLS